MEIKGNGQNYMGICLDVTTNYYIIGFKNPRNNRYFNLKVPKHNLLEGSEDIKVDDIVNISISSRSTEKNIIPLSISPVSKFDFDVMNMEKSNIHVLNKLLLKRVLFALEMEGYNPEDFIDILYYISMDRYVVEFKIPLPVHILRYEDNR